ncbi:hypothetical protein [Streptomyces sp. CBMA152]|uniref:hypothetical protein n=1 Tax=Streptomyces sp. CBMA152 TaxID=1896312 RepID=UPI001661199F|nr:hypothetical protein [Streptomyces sp. CBMA152]MBD0744209.1 hypothetical protein [Streptomyces sp. CBMA152]MBD0746769.1 hypothetical protein [Streptomyces sp. CBMA152]
MTTHPNPIPPTDPAQPPAPTPEPVPASTDASLRRQLQAVLVVVLVLAATFLFYVLLEHPAAVPALACVASLATIAGGIYAFTKLVNHP